MDLDQVLAAYEALPEQAKEAVKADAIAATKHMRFLALPGPQTDAYLSDADILLYGGSAGSGKTGLIVGLPVNEHQRGIIFRRESSQTDGLIAFAKEVIGDTARFNGQDNEFNWPDGRNLKFAGMKEPDDWRKHAGRERDYIGFDEGAEFLEQQVSSILAWLRAEPGKRCRVVFASNPPRSSDGAWMIEWFAPWLDKQYPNPAKAGELRWAVMAAGKTVWVDGPGEHVIKGETYTAMSRTFIPAALKDNPYRNTAEYRARLQSLPEPLRSQLLYGEFGAGQEDGLWQAVPTAWVHAAMQRWEPTPPAGVPMCSIGTDVAQGGADKTVLAWRHDGWYAPLLAVPGEQTPNGTDVAGLVISKRRDGAKVVIDIGGGWGGDAYAHLKANDVDVVSFMGVKPSLRRTQDNQLRFANVRTEAWWQFREALNPDQQNGSPICLPDDRELLADLTAPTYTIGSNGIQLEPKDKLVKRLGRSPDRADAAVMAWWAGARAASDLKIWEQGIGKNRRPAVVLGHANARRKMK